MPVFTRGDAVSAMADFESLPIGTEIIPNHLYYRGMPRGAIGNYLKFAPGSWGYVRHASQLDTRLSATGRDLSSRNTWRIVYVGSGVLEPEGPPCECEDCRLERGESVTRFCAHCEGDFEFSRRSDYDNFCDNDCYRQYYRDDDDDHNGCDCSSCASSASRLVHNYNYRPPLNFWRANADQDETLFFGFELEVPTDIPGDFAQEMLTAYGRDESLLFCKEDVSIDGVEIVSHPMTHKYFRDEFPFEMFDGRRKLTKLLREREF